jgi:hypothetical protein
MLREKLVVYVFPRNRNNKESVPLRTGGHFLDQVGVFV